MIILISSDGSNITALDVPSDIQSELGRYLAPGVVMVATCKAESQHAMTISVKVPGLRLCEDDKEQS